MGNSKTKNNGIISLNINKKVVTDSRQIAEELNKYYINISSELNCLNNTPINAAINSLKIRMPISNKIFIPAPMREKEIKNIISSLKNKTSQDIFGLTNVCIKFCCKNLIKPLTQLVNQSFNEGKFPDRLKFAKILPIFKKGEKTAISNYRPISILPIFSKIFERAMYKRIITYLEENSILCTEQSGFQKNKSTMRAIFQLTKN